MDTTDPNQDRRNCWAVVKAAMNSRVSTKFVEFIEDLVASLGGLRSMELFPKILVIFT